MQSRRNNCPNYPGLKIITTKTQLINIPKNFYVDIPEELSEEINKAKPEYIMDIGVKWTQRQVEELLVKKVPAVHFYIMQNTKPILRLMEKLKI
jgi:methylenetetrahydrofolate reductase (NADPH)